MKIYLDDLRKPYDRSWTLARSTEEFKKLIINSGGQISAISFDHDLGENKLTGYDAAKWFVNEVLDNSLLGNKLKTVIAHSDNPPGRENIAAYFESAKAHGVFDADLQIIRRPASNKY